MVRAAADRYAKGETMAELARDYDVPAGAQQRFLSQVAKASLSADGREYEVGEATIWRALAGGRPFEASAST